MTTPLVKVEGLFKFFESSEGKLPVLRDVSFEVQAGEFVCIMGPSGSGKTTLLHILSGLDAPSAGSVSLRGRNLQSLSERDRTLERRATIGYVFQFFNLLPNLTVLENVGLPLSIQGQQPRASEGDLRASLERFGLDGKERNFPHQLSGGEMQRTSIVRALAGGQPLLLCDEPTGNLSQKAGLGVMETLRDVRSKDDRTVLLVTHNPRDATFADRVLFLVDGVLDESKALVAGPGGAGLKVEQVHEALAALHI